MMKHTSGKSTHFYYFLYDGDVVPSTPIQIPILFFQIFICRSGVVDAVRMGPWMGEGSVVFDKPKVREMYHESKYKVDKYPYLYEGLTTIEEFRPYYCPMEILDTGYFLNCDGVESIDNGTLAERFERFVKDYSGLDPFDIQLRTLFILIIERIGSFH